jgi:hypothetical protein
MLCLAPRAEWFDVSAVKNEDIETEKVCPNCSLERETETWEKGEEKDKPDRKLKKKPPLHVIST